jgi:hypothetical protein
MFGRRLRRTVGLAAIVVGLATASSASAMTATLGEPDLIARVALTVPVTVTCDAPSPGLVVFSQSVSVVVEQAAGKDIARGTGNVFSSFPALTFPCNGTPTPLTVGVLADPNGPPFHGGPAVVRVTVSATAGVPLPCCPGAFMGPFETQTAVIGPAEVRLR